VVVDREMVDYYKNEDIENYVFTIMNMVSDITVFQSCSSSNAIITNIFIKDITGNTIFAELDLTLVFD